MFMFIVMGGSTNRCFTHFDAIHIGPKRRFPIRVNVLQLQTTLDPRLFSVAIDCMKITFSRINFHFVVSLFFVLSLFIISPGLVYSI
jgi:hypothetical protein